MKTIRMPSEITPDSVERMLLSMGFPAFGYDAEDETVTIVKSGYEVRYPGDFDYPNKSRIVVSYFVKGEKARATAAQRAIKAVKVEKAARSLRAIFRGVKIAASRTSLSFPVPGSAAAR
jgi:hypothetical protein